jgi:NTP pyrophosphatase (non-canonical NTP hydrolase)
MNLNELQNEVDQWIKNTDIGYFDILTNTIILSEEVGEFSSVVARKYGMQKAKKGDSENIEEEIGDILWVLTCLSNQLGINLEDCIKKNIVKKSKRDVNRF